MTRAEFDVYLSKFNARDYAGFLDYFADDFELYCIGRSHFGRQEVLDLYAFLHAYVKEHIVVDRFLSDTSTIALEARVQLEGITDLTAETIAASGWPRLVPVAAGERIEIPQFIHYHLEDGRFVKVVCLP